MRQLDLPGCFNSTRINDDGERSVLSRAKRVSLVVRLVGLVGPCGAGTSSSTRVLAGCLRRSGCRRCSDLVAARVPKGNVLSTLVLVPVLTLETRLEITRLLKGV